MMSISPFSQSAQVLLESRPGMASPERFALQAPKLPKNATGYAVPLIPVHTDNNGDYFVLQAPNFDNTLPAALSVIR